MEGGTVWFACPCRVISSPSKLPNHCNQWYEKTIPFTIPPIKHSPFNFICNFIWNIHKSTVCTPIFIRYLRFYIYTYVFIRFISNFWMKKLLIKIYTEEKWYMHFHLHIFIFSLPFLNYITINTFLLIPYLIQPVNCRRYFLESISR